MHNVGSLVVMPSDQYLETKSKSQSLVIICRLISINSETMYNAGPVYVINNQ